MTDDIEHLGLFIDGCSLEGESRADRVATANPNVIQLSRDRWLVVYYTWGFCGIDDGRSIIYELREGRFDGPVITEGILAKRIVGWDLDLGREMPDIAVVRRYGHVVAFGVPKGARIRGKVAENENVFAVRWLATPRLMNTKGGYILWTLRHQEWADYHRSVEWMQFRLNDAEDDIAMEEENCPIAHMCKVVPHAGGNEQYYALQVRSSHLLKNGPGFGLRPLTPELEQASAIYYGKMRYAESAPAEWEFGD